MIMHLQRRSRPRSSLARRLISLVLACGLIVLLGWYGRVLWGWLAGPAFFTAKYAWHAEGAGMSRLARLGAYFDSKTDLQRVNRGLTERLAQLEVLALDRQVLYTENLALRAALSQDVALPAEHVVPVVAGLWRPPYDMITLEVGSLPSGTVAHGDYVVAHGSLLLGEVVELIGGVAKIKLFSVPGLETPVLVGTGEIPGVALGRGGGNYASRLPRGVEVHEGDVIRAVLPGLARSLVLGVVGAVEHDPSDSLQTVYSRTPINLQQLQQVALVPRGAVLGPELSATSTSTTTDSPDGVIDLGTTNDVESE